MLSETISNNEISISEQNEEIKNEAYSKELTLLYNEILEDLKKSDDSGTGKVTEEALLEFLQNKLPPQRQLNIPLFKPDLKSNPLCKPITLLFLELITGPPEEPG